MLIVRLADFRILKFLKFRAKNSQNYHVHISNSSAIRYAELFPFSKNHQIFATEEPAE
jgi:hypothetical protein